MEQERPPVLGMMERGGQVVIHWLANVKHKMLEPLMKDPMELGTLVYTDAYSMYAVLRRGATTIRASTMDGANAPAMKLATGFVKCM